MSNHAPVTVLSVSPFVEDHEVLAQILTRIRGRFTVLRQ